MPFSQSITCQETVREGKLYNLPLNLIVQGDLIRLKPGQTISLSCKSISQDSNSQPEIYQRGSVFEPSNYTRKKSSLVDEMLYESGKNARQSFYDTYVESCELKKVPEPIYCHALETPYLSYLK